jgi:hypothetical protein
MEESNFKSLHIISESIIVGGLSIYVFKRISELESTVEELKQQITMQNNQLRYLLGSTSSNFSQPGTTPLRMSPIPHRMRFAHPLQQVEDLLDRGKTPCGSSTRMVSTVPSEGDSSSMIFDPNHQSEWFTSSPNKSKMECKGGVCTLVRGDCAEPRSLRPLAEDDLWSSEGRNPRSVRGEVLDDTPSPKGEGVSTILRCGIGDKTGQETDKKVVISKFSKQFEFDIDAPIGDTLHPLGEGISTGRRNDLDQSSKVNTFTKFSPNPVLKSVTPKPSLTTENDHGNEANELDNILNEIDNE